MHQAAGGVVDIDKQGGLWAAVFEPPVLGAVDLHQLTQTIAPRPRLVDALYSVLAPNPEPGADHLLPQCFDPKIQAMQLGQLLGRQGGAKIDVALAHEGQHGLAEHRTQSAVASAYHASAKSHRPDHQHGRSAAVGRSVFVRRRSAPWRLRQIGARQRHRSAPEGASARCGSS